MAAQTCLFTNCRGPSKWKTFGISKKEYLTYSKLLGQKREFHQFIEFNDIKISKSGKTDSYCIVDKKYSPSKGSKIDIFIFDKKDHSALYLEYSVNNHYVNKNCNDLITFLNFNKNSTLYLYSSFAYIKTTERFKWIVFFSVLEFFIKNMNMSIIGSQFYFPLFSKYLIINELRLLLILQNWFQSVQVNFIKTFSQTCEISTLKLQQVLPFQNPKNHAYFRFEQAGRKKNLSPGTCKSLQKLQLKRKSVDLYSEDDFLPKTKRINTKKNVCHCKIYKWKIYPSFKKHVVNYTSILKDKKDVEDPDAIFPIDCELKTNCMQSNHSTLHANQSGSIQDVSLSSNASKITFSRQLLKETSELKNTSTLCLEKTKKPLPDYRLTSDFQTLKQMKSASDNKESCTLSDIYNFSSAMKYENKKTYPKATFVDDIQKHIAGPTGELPSKADFVGINKDSVTFQTTSKNSLKITETSIEAAEKMFEDISSENMDIFTQMKSKNAAQSKSFVNNKHYVGFQTASGKTLHASQAALESAKKMFKEISVEESNLFSEREFQNKQKYKESYPSVEKCVSEDISKDLTEDFFEDNPFEEKEINTRPSDDFEALSVQKTEKFKTAQTYKIRKSLGGQLPSAGPSGQLPSKADFVGINKHSVTFQPISGNSLKISEAAFQAAEKMFEDISSENIHSFTQIKSKNAAQSKSFVNNKRNLGFHTASGKTLHASQAALDAATKMFKEISVEESNLFSEREFPNKQKKKESYPSIEECVSEDISKDLPDNFFEGIPFEEKEINTRPSDDSEALSVQKTEKFKTAQTYKIRRSLGGQLPSAGPSGQLPSKVDFVKINKHPVTFQPTSGNSLKITETAFQAAEKMFEDMSSESIDMFTQIKNKSAAQSKSFVNDKCNLGFQTASGKTLHASQAALDAATNMFKEISVEESNLFSEREFPNKQKKKECYPSVEECVYEDISKNLPDNFFEGIPFEEKEINTEPFDDSELLSVQKAEKSKTTQTFKIRKSLGGRRSLKPYTLKK